MRVNKLDFLKENTLFRNGKSKEELLRNNTTVSTAENRELTAKKLCFVDKLWFYQGDEQADGRFNFLAADFLGMFVGAVYMEGGRSYTQIITGLIVNLFWNTILINRFFIFIFFKMFEKRAPISLKIDSQFLQSVSQVGPLAAKIIPVCF